MSSTPLDSASTQASASCLPPGLGVGIVSHFSDHVVLRRTLASLYAALQVALESGALSQASLILVDNSGDAGEAQRLQALLGGFSSPGVAQQFISGLPNHGYGAANNVALRHSQADLHLVLNPDVELNRAALHEGVHALQDNPDCVLLTPFATDPSGQRQHVAKSMPGFMTLFGRALPGISGALRDRMGNARYELRGQLNDSPVKGVFLAGGCFMLCRSRELQAVGGFDESFFMYFEDFDLSLRLCAGQPRVLYAPSVRIVHGGGQAASKGLRHIRWFAASALRFFNRHGWRWSS